MNGNDIIIKLNGTVIAGTKSNEINTSCDTIEVASPDQGSWKDYIPARKEWNITTSFLLAQTSNVQSCLNIGTKYTLTICKNENGGTTYLTGDAILTSYKITATKGNILNGSYTFQGCGELA